MKIYSDEEIERIGKIKEKNDKIEEILSNQRASWNEKLEPLFQVFKLEINNQSTTRIMETQAMSLSYKQLLNEEISRFLDRRSKQDVKLKRLKQEKFIWYATSFGVKTNMGEKTLLIDSHVSEEQRHIELIESYIEFLRQTNKNLESLQYTIKNIIELFNYLGK